eukprot:TRINITY_DN1220_c0_g2_i1.p1 TRINITY_DN1220_c0_g2~~TRINITY_DN1220_c0_g2_i1.p1  ORF type:complete len:1306 (+),score=188.72 TRINITY_DN1220_c0_g2_i1:446-3919(+)
MEYCAGRELFDRIIDYGHLEEGDARHITYQVARALKYAHARGIAHRDIKPENVCFCDPDPQSLQVKVIDWGLASHFDKARMTSTVGTHAYAAPEVLEDCDETKSYGSACDLWSLGVLVYVMLGGREPFCGSIKQQLERMKNEQVPMTTPLWGGISRAAKDFIKALLKCDSRHRLSSESLLLHPWLREKASPVCKSLAGKVFANLDQFARRAQNLSKLGESSHFFAMCLASVARQIDHNNLQDVQHVFQDLDSNGDGVLELHELQTGFEIVFGASSNELERVEELFDAMDLDKSGRVDYTEFCMAGVDEEVSMQEHVLWAAFKAFDVGDDDGKVTAEEISEVLAKVDVRRAWSTDSRAKMAREMVERFDHDGDGSIDFHEWMQLMRSSCSSRWYADERCKKSGEHSCQEGSPQPLEQHPLPKLVLNLPTTIPSADTGLGMSSASRSTTRTSTSSSASSLHDTAAPRVPTTVILSVGSDVSDAETPRSPCPRSRDSMCSLNSPGGESISSASTASTRPAAPLLLLPTACLRKRGDEGEMPRLQSKPSVDVDSSSPSPAATTRAPPAPMLPVACLRPPQAESASQPQNMAAVTCSSAAATSRPALSLMLPDACLRKQNERRPGSPSADSVSTASTASTRRPSPMLPMACLRSPDDIQRSPPPPPSATCHAAATQSRNAGSPSNQQRSSSLDSTDRRPTSSEDGVVSVGDVGADAGLQLAPCALALSQVTSERESCRLLEDAVAGSSSTAIGEWHRPERTGGATPDFATRDALKGMEAVRQLHGAVVLPSSTASQTVLAEHSMTFSFDGVDRLHMAEPSTENPTVKTVPDEAVVSNGLAGRHTSKPTDSNEEFFAYSAGRLVRRRSSHTRIARSGCCLDVPVILVSQAKATPATSKPRDTRAESAAQDTEDVLEAVASGAQEDSEDVPKACQPSFYAGKLVFRKTPGTVQQRSKTPVIGHDAHDFHVVKSAEAAFSVYPSFETERGNSQVPGLAACRFGQVAAAHPRECLGRQDRGRPAEAAPSMQTAAPCGGRATAGEMERQSWPARVKAAAEAIAAARAAAEAAAAAAAQAAQAAQAAGAAAAAVAAASAAKQHSAIAAPSPRMRLAAPPAANPRAGSSKPTGCANDRTQKTFISPLRLAYLGARRDRYQDVEWDEQRS